MEAKESWWLAIAAGATLYLSAIPSLGFGQDRLWTDTTGDFSVVAEFVRIDRGNAVLRRKDDGQEISVPLRKLSPRDRAYIKAQRDTTEAVAEKSPANGPAQVAEEFYNQLRDAGENRNAVLPLLTPKAQEAIKKAKDASPLAALPVPDEGRRAIRVGRAATDDKDSKLAAVPVQIRATGMVRTTKVHLRQEGENWLVYAIGEVSPDGEDIINFEEPAPKDGAGSLAALVGKPFPFAGMTLDGRRVELSKYQGKAVLVNYWATWSQPAAKEMANIAANFEKYRDQGFDVIAVSIDQDLDALAKLLKARQPPWAIVVDNLAGPTNSTAAHYGIHTVPTSILVGQDGKVIAVNCQGPVLGQQLAKLFGSAAEAGAAEKPGRPPQSTAQGSAPTE